MTDKDVPEPDALELVVRARRNALTAAERNTFDQALATSASVRTAYEVGSDLDLATRVQPGDEALLDRALARAFAEHRPLRARRLPRAVAALAATLALASAAAATRQVIVWRSEARSAHIAAVERASSNRAPRGGERSAAPPSAAEIHNEATSTAPAAPQQPAPSSVPAPVSATARSHAAPAPVPQTTPASLFRDAGAARRAGDFTRARALYAELASRFPDSTEARVSRVSLGKLLLSAGNAREAEAVFAQYLRSGASDLREEALVGRADALSALGRSAEERRARLELVRRYPESVYANRARERIVEIDGVEPAPAP
jgi:TolA-binding protein